MAGKVGMPFSNALHPRGLGGLFSMKPKGLKIKRKRPNKAIAHLASPAKQRKMATRSPFRTKPFGFPSG